MKDGYSFDVDEAAADQTYQAMYEAYTRIFSRCGLRFKSVEADSGPIGGSFSHEFMVLAETGEDVVVSCSACAYAANLRRPKFRRRQPQPSKSPGPWKKYTPRIFAPWAKWPIFSIFPWKKCSRPAVRNRGRRGGGGASGRP